MHIAHFTNTFLPHVGGVARAVQTLLEDQRRARHSTLVVAPEFEDGPAPARIERYVERVPALTNFNSSDFSVRLPIASALSERLADFPADLIHAHHPFLLGTTALREAASRQIPIVFTHHTLYERYTHYLPFDSDAVREFAAELATRFANHCDAVIAPSESVRKLIVERGVEVPVHVIPTGIDTARIARGNGPKARQKWKIPADAVVLGHLGRLAEEKNLPFLSQAIVRAMRDAPGTYALIIGDGPQRETMAALLDEAGLSDRTVFTGKLSGHALYSACAAMDVFAFSSTSETQGLVLAEAMAAGCPVVALDASGVREVVQDGQNGRLLPHDATVETFAAALGELLTQPEQRRECRRNALATAERFDHHTTNKQMLALYRDLIRADRARRQAEDPWRQQLDPWIERILTEGRLLLDPISAAFDHVSLPHLESEPKSNQC